LTAIDDCTRFVRSVTVEHEVAAVSDLLRDDYVFLVCSLIDEDGVTDGGRIDGGLDRRVLQWYESDCRTPNLAQNADAQKCEQNVHKGFHGASECLLVGTAAIGDPSDVELRMETPAKDSHERPIEN